LTKRVYWKNDKAMIEKMTRWWWRNGQKWHLKK
jgi:hypothetical protein